MVNCREWASACLSVCVCPVQSEWKNKIKKRNKFINNNLVEGVCDVCAVQLLFVVKRVTRNARTQNLCYSLCVFIYLSLSRTIRTEREAKKKIIFYFVLWILPMFFPFLRWFFVSFQSILRLLLLQLLFIACFSFFPCRFFFRRSHSRVECLSLSIAVCIKIHTFWYNFGEAHIHI